MSGHECEVVACPSPSTVTFVAPGLGSSEVAKVAKDHKIDVTPFGRGFISTVTATSPTSGHTATTGPSKPALMPLHKVPVTHCTVPVAAAVSSSTVGAPLVTDLLAVVVVQRNIVLLTTSLSVGVGLSRGLEGGLARNV